MAENTRSTELPEAAWDLLESEMTNGPKPADKLGSTMTPTIDAAKAPFGLTNEAAKKQKSKKKKMQDPLPYQAYIPPMPTSIRPKPYFWDDDSDSEASSLSKISSVSQILPNDEEAPMDKLCRFNCWNRNLYVTYCDATLEDYHRYLWLLRFGQPGCWYLQPSEASMLLLRDQREDQPSSILAPYQAAVPSALRCPRLNVGKAMTTASQALAKLAGAEPFRYSRVAPRNIKNLRYLSVVEAPHGSGEYSKSCNSSPSYPACGESKLNDGAPLFKLVTTGSRESAATQAFYDAGANGWSTVFTCVVVGCDGPKYGASFLRSDSMQMQLDPMLIPEGKDIGRVVFY